MARWQPTVRRYAMIAVALGLAVGVGCTNPKGGPRPFSHTKQPPVNMPAPGSVPTELNPVSLPEYVVEPPDVLVINAVIRDLADPAKPGEKEKPGSKFADSVRSLPIQPVYGEYPIRPDGTVFLGVYGSVPVSGYTLKQAAAAIRNALAKQLFDGEGIKEDRLLVVADVSGYNSKSYYVVTDGGGAGERVFRFPITGKEFVFDALANINGLPEESSKRNIWVARRTPNMGDTDQILPVDWVGITQHGYTVSNYQLFPGDRVYVKAQRLVTLDRTMARVISPIERLFGVTLLGASTYNQITGRGNGFGSGR